MSLRAWAMILIAASFFLSGLAETLSATGFAIEVSPKANWDTDAHTLALGSVFGILPRFFTPEAPGSPITSLLSSMAVIGGLLHWLHLERTHDHAPSAAP